MGISLSIALNWNDLSKKKIPPKRFRVRCWVRWNILNWASSALAQMSADKWSLHQFRCRNKIAIIVMYDGRIFNFNSALFSQPFLSHLPCVCLVIQPCTSPGFDVTTTLPPPSIAIQCDNAFDPQTPRTHKTSQWHLNVNLTYYRPFK